MQAYPAMILRDRVQAQPQRAETPLQYARFAGHWMVPPDIQLCGLLMTEKQIEAVV